MNLAMPSAEALQRERMIALPPMVEHPSASMADCGSSFRDRFKADVGGRLAKFGGTCP
jgi:hypothetical protein